MDLGMYCESVFLCTVVVLGISLDGVHGNSEYECHHWVLMGKS